METKRLSEPTGPVHITRERIRGFTPRHCAHFCAHAPSKLIVMEPNG
jgi:hypothetical protein